MLIYGRPSGYRFEGRVKEAYIIGICGGCGVGKTAFSQRIIKKLGVTSAVILSMDSFLNVVSQDENMSADQSEFNFDCFKAIDFDLVVETLRSMRTGKKVDIPIYDFRSSSRIEGKQSVVYGPNVIVIEGFMTFNHKELYELLDLKIYVDADSDLRLARKILRDIEERHKVLPFIISQYCHNVKPNHDKIIAPQSQLADFVISWNEFNEQGIEVVSRFAKNNLEERGHIYNQKVMFNKIMNDSIISKLHIIPTTKQNIALQTLIRDSKTTRQDFLKYSNRLMKICFVKALSLLDYKEKIIKFAGNTEASLRYVLAKKICEVIVIKDRDSFEPSLKDILYEYERGKILLQTNDATVESNFNYIKLPKDICDFTVLLLVAKISTGKSSLAAIQILIDYKLKESDIILCTLAITPSEAREILNAFPHIRIVATILDPEDGQNNYILPGPGNFDDL